MSAIDSVEVDADATAAGGSAHLPVNGCGGHDLNESRPHEHAEVEPGASTSS